MLTGGRRGQAMIELALGLPLLIVLLVGTVDISVLGSDHLQGEHAAREGARVAASLGGRLANLASETSPGAAAKRQQAMDLAVCDTVREAFGAAPFADLSGVIVYRPDRADGTIDTNQFQQSTASSVADVMVIDLRGKCVLGRFRDYTLDKRVDVPGREAVMGVLVQWNFKPIPGSDLAFTRVEQHATMRLPPAAP